MLSGEVGSKFSDSEGNNYKIKSIIHDLGKNEIKMDVDIRINKPLETVTIRIDPKELGLTTQEFEKAVDEVFKEIEFNTNISEEDLANDLKLSYAMKDTKFDPLNRFFDMSTPPKHQNCRPLKKSTQMSKFQDTLARLAAGAMNTAVDVGRFKDVAVKSLMSSFEGLPALRDELNDDLMKKTEDKIVNYIAERMRIKLEQDFIDNGLIAPPKPKLLGLNLGEPIFDEIHDWNKSKLDGIFNKMTDLYIGEEK